MAATEETVSVGAKAAELSFAPTDPGPLLFTTRAELVAKRAEVIDRVIVRMQREPDFERVIIAEIYAGTLETRLALKEFDDFMHEGAMGFLGKVPGRRKKKGEDDG